MKWAKHVTSISLVILIFAAMIPGVSAAKVSYLPDVDPAMAEASCWTQDTEILMKTHEARQYNAQIIAANGTNMYDLKKHEAAV